MPATLREVLRSNTFEDQRLIINSLGQDVYDFASGSISSSIRLDDGTVSSPALFFDSDLDLGLYKSSTGSLTISSSNTNVASFKASELYVSKPLSVNKDAIGSVLGGVDLVLQSGGLGYPEGDYTNISLIGGTGVDAVASFSVSGFGGQIINAGNGYTPGSYAGVTLLSGDGAGLTADINIDGIVGTVSSGGNGYLDNDYFNVPLINGSGTGAEALINISGGSVQSVTITSEGNLGYQNGDILTASNSNLGGQGAGFTFTITNSPFTISSNNFTQTSSGVGYNSGNILVVASADVGGTGSGFQYQLSGGGVVTSLSLANGGSGYSINDILTFDSSDLEARIEYQVEVRSSQFLEFSSPYPTTGFSVGSLATIGAETRTISRVYTSGSNVIGVVIDTSVDGNYTNAVGQTITSGAGSATVASEDFANMYYVDDGSGFVAAPDLVLQTGITYAFTSNDFVNHPAAFSETPDGIHTNGGVKYEGSEVSYSQTEATIKLTSSSPEPLYLYCEVHPNMNGFDGYEGEITKGSAYVSSGAGAQFRVASILDQVYFYVDLDGNVQANDLEVNNITANDVTIAGALEITGETVFSGGTSVGNNLSVEQSGLIQDTLTVFKNLIVSTELSDGTGEILCSENDNIVLGFFSAFLSELGDIEEGYVLYSKDNIFIGVVDVVESNTRLLLKENSRISITTSESFKYTSSAGLFYNQSDGLFGVSNLLPEYSVDIGGSFKTDENTILSEDIGFKTVIGDRLNLDSMTDDDKLYVDGNILTTGNIFLSNSENLSSPSLSFTDDNSIGLYYNNTDKFISVTGYTGELSSFKYDSLHFYRDSNFTSRNVEEYLIQSGSGYTQGTYSEVELVGGTGNGLTANVTVAFSTKTVTPGEGYTAGEYTSVPLSGSTGNGAIATITISSGNIADNIQITNTGSGYESTPVVSFTDASGADAIATAVLSDSASLKNIALNSAGSGYSSAPSVIIGTEWSATNTVSEGEQYFSGSNLYTVTIGGTFGSVPPSHTSGSAFNGQVELTYAGSVATATASLGTDVGINDDEVSFIIINNYGSGYTSTPQVILSGGGGEGATAAASLGYTIDSVIVNDGGSGYVSPTLVFTGGNPDTTAVASVSVTNQGVSKVVITDPGTGYVVGETLTFSESDLVNPDTGDSSSTPTIAASLQITELGSVSVVDITSFGFGYEQGDNIVFDTLTVPGNTGGENFSLTILSTLEENVVTIDLENSLLTSTGIKSLDGGINVNDNITIGDSGLSKTTSGNLVLGAIDFVQISGSKALILPSGTTGQRPALTSGDVGAIRYNTSESRFEGFNGSFFVSLGGVRDVDGNTYISAELNPGDDDNTLRFVNDDVQSMQIEKDKITLETIDDIVVIDLEGIEEWQALGLVTAPADLILDPPVLIYYEDRVYSVRTTGAFSASTPPTHTSGTVTNGTVDLLYVRSIYGSVVYTGADLNLTLEEINLNENGLRISSDNTVSAKLITEAPDFIIGFTDADDPFVKFSDGGSLSVNTGFGGVENYIQVLDYELKQFDLKDTRVVSAVGSIDTSVGNAVNIIIAEYDVQTSTLPLHSGKLMVEIVDDSATPKRQYSEISYLTKSDLSDILYTETNKIYSDDELCDVSVGIDNSNNITCDIVDLTGSTTTVYSIKVVSQAILV